MTILMVILALVLPVQEEYVYFTIPDATGGEVPVRLYTPTFSGAPLIVAIPEWGETMDNWDPVARKFRELGFGVLLFTYPDHEPGNKEKYKHSDGDILNYLGRIKTVVDYAGGRSRVIHLLGSGIGANLAVLFAVENDLPGRIAAISPGINYRSLTITPEFAMKVAPQLLLAASQEDTYAAYSLRLMSGLYEKLPENERPQILLYSNVGHGVWMLKRLSESIASITRWYSDYGN